MEVGSEFRARIAGVPTNTQRKCHLEIELIQAQARLEAIHLQEDPFWAMGIALYWAEGTKSSRRLELAHSEPQALRLFMSWARRHIRPDAIFAAAINLRSDNDEPAAKDYRSAELGIDPVPFTKTFIKPDGTGHRKNHLLSGVCRVTMKRSTDAFITTITWVDFVRESFQN